MTDDQDLIQLALQIAQDENGQVPIDALPQPGEPLAAAVEEDLASSAQISAHPNFQNRAATKELKTADQLADMILSDLQQVNGCPKAGVTVTVYGLDPWNSWLHFGAAAGPVRNKAELQEFCTILTDRLKRRYDIRTDDAKSD